MTTMSSTPLSTAEIKTVKVADDAKILDKDGNITSTKAVKADGLYKSYATNKYGVITTLRQFETYTNGSAKAVFRWRRH